ncbi:hypothetical protein M8J76_004375 [Diaphorina citri]|nr:hypothetical protein M8J75_002765 [Diaphorina citri]KAI5744683.1 hypothetical protein M8J76_004375 [Diaphorina citri]KAI5750832.1 hypothetical protein M8J77_001595 [Diaphorina citri]
MDKSNNIIKLIMATVLNTENPTARILVGKFSNIINSSKIELAEDRANIKHMKTVIRVVVVVMELECITVYIIHSSTAWANIRLDNMDVLFTLSLNGLRINSNSTGDTQRATT